MTLKRACSLLTVKSFSEDERVITGIASTPSPDRDGDILEPEGAEFGSTIPFLWQHDHSRPVGQCTVRRVREGLEITATLVKPVPDMPSQMAPRQEKAWATMKTRLGQRALRQLPPPINTPIWKEAECTVSAGNRSRAPPYTQLRAHETWLDVAIRLVLEK
ncbi:hypothetical protein AUS52_21100 [Escherichia coli]|nr:hypothetical protein AUS52_21100 [Escherichia coli]